MNAEQTLFKTISYRSQKKAKMSNAYGAKTQQKLMNSLCALYIEQSY